MSTPESRPYVCSLCESAFRRAEHLKRHTKAHAGLKHYFCPCGRSFSRSDVLSRHLQTCSQGREVDQNRTSQKQSRSKSACDQCARSKLKCDGQDPCGRCLQRHVGCTHMRAGYQDMYEPYSLSQADLAQETVPAELQPTPLPMALDQIESITLCERDILDSADQLQAGYLEDPGVETVVEGPLLASTSLTIIDGQPFGQSFDLLDNFQFGLNESTSSSHVPFTSLADFLSDPIGNRDIYSSIGDPTAGLNLEQLDPVEIKCEEVRTLLTRSKHLQHDRTLISCITRENMLLFTELYARHYSQHFPFLHRPSFRITETPVFLLSAILIVGACFADGPMSANDVVKLAIALLNLIENEDHEVNMRPPPISTIQASIATCSVLICSRSQRACRFLSNYIPRNASMARRAGLPHVGEIEPDYSTITIETFDWKAWIDRETKRRIAAEIFCNEMAGCIFHGLPPELSRIQTKMLLPTYERCWEAPTASDCLQALKSYPRPIYLSTAIEKLRACTLPTLAPSFETSGYGMFVLIKALHCLLFQATKYEVEFSSLDRSDCTDQQIVPSQGRSMPDLSSFLRGNLSGTTIAKMADETIESSGSSSLKHINNVLNSWYTSWHLRAFREPDYEERIFVQNPLPFWWLAKLYIILHHFRHCLREDSEFAVHRVQDANCTSKLHVQLKIMRWFIQFRGPQSHSDPMASNIFAKLVSSHVPDPVTGPQLAEQVGIVLPQGAMVH